MATLSVQEVSLTGTKISTTAAAAGGDEFANDGNTLFLIENGDAASHTITFTGQGDCSMGFTHDASVDVPAGESRTIGPFGKHRFNDSDGNVQVSYDDVTSVTVAAYKEE